MNALIAIPYSEGQIFQHLGRATQFKIYKVEEDKVVSSEVVDTEGTGHEDLALWLVWHAVNGVICGKGGGILDPRGKATRGQTAKMLCHFCENIAG